MRYRVWIALLVGGLITAWGFACGRAEDVLRVAPDNTVILDNTDYAGRVLQYYLIRGFVGSAAAQAYALDQKSDRAAAPHFPLLADRRDVAIPDGKLVLAVGPTRFLQPADRARLEAHPGAILLQRQGNVVVLAGQPFTGWTGTFTAVSEFLDRVAGIRCYAPPELWHSRPRQPWCAIDTLALFRPQCFVTSQLAPYWKPNAEWLRMNQNGGRMTIQCFHNLANIFPPEKYGTSHPQIYEQRGGQRQVPLSIGTKVWNPCLSAPELPDLALAYIREVKRTRPLSTYVALGMMDIAFACQCDACQASVRQGGSYSHLYFGFVNEVARRCRTEFPDLYLTCFAYGNANQPPTGLKFEPNVAVKIVLKTYRLPEPEYERELKAKILAFAGAGARWFFHDWRFAGVTPRNDLPAVAAFLRWAHAHHCLGAYYEYSPEQNFYLDGAYYWILMRLTSDPELDVRGLWQQYCDDMFGAASGLMQRFYRHFEEKQATAYQHLDRLGDLPREEPALYSAADVAWERATLEQAIAATRDDPPVQERLGQVLRHFRAHELFALATHVPYQLRRQFAGPGLNRALLAYYLNDDGRTLAEAVRYYQTERNLPPATGDLEMRLGYLPSVVENYSRGLGTLLDEIGRQARADLPPDLRGQAKVDAWRSRSAAVFRTHAPEQARPERTAFFAQLLDKALYVPRVDEPPQLDGVLADAAWQHGATLDGFSIRSLILPSRHATRGKLLRCGDRLLVGLVCEQDGPIWAQTPRDTITGTHIWRESGVEIVFGPVGAAVPRDALAQYDINAFGAFRGFFQAQDHRAEVEVAVRLDEAARCYVLEAALPLHTAHYDFRGHEDLAFNVVRMIYTRDSYGADELLAWHPTSVGVITMGSQRSSGDNP